MSRLEQLQKLAAAQPDDPLIHYGLGLEWMQLEQWQEAIEAFQRTIQIDARYYPAYQQKARAELKLARRAEAAATLETGIALAQTAGDLHAADQMRKTLETLT